MAPPARGTVGVRPCFTAAVVSQFRTALELYAIAFERGQSPPDIQPDFSDDDRSVTLRIDAE